MSTIGQFTRDGDGFTGFIRTLSFTARVQFVPEPGDRRPGHPDYRVHAGRVEIGAAWRKTSEAGRDYLSVALDDPCFPQPINAALVEGDGGAFQLAWSRPRPRG